MEASDAGGTTVDEVGKLRELAADMPL